MEDKIVELMTQVQKAVGQVAPQAFDFAVQHEYWCGVGCVGVGLALLTISIISLIAAYFVNKKWPGPKEYSAPPPAGAVPLVIATVAFLASMTQLLNPWNWVAVINPKIALFHDLMNRFLNR